MDKKSDELDMRSLDAVTGGGSGEMSETESFALQMAMEQKSQFAQVFSNMMKSHGDTASQIAPNLK